VRHLAQRGIAADAGDPRLAQRCALFKDRCATLEELAQWLSMFDAPVPQHAQDRDAHLTDAARPGLAALRERLRSVPWDKAAIAQAFKDTLTEQRIKMPQLAVPVRVAVCGRVQTPAIDAVLALFDREVVLERLDQALN
jgi:glutamyl-tRNA synthetase